MSNKLYEKIDIHGQKGLVFKFDGTFSFKKGKKDSKCQISIPKSKKKITRLNRNLAKLVKNNKCVLNGVLITHDFRLIKKTEKIYEQFQSGGFTVVNNIVLKRKKRNEKDAQNKRLKIEIDKDGYPNKRRKLDEVRFYEIGDFFDLVNVRYTITYVTHFSGYDYEHEQHGFLRNVPLNQVQRILEQISQDYCDRQAYPTGKKNF